MRAIFVCCVCADTRLVTLVAASLPRHLSEMLKLRVTVEHSFVTAPPAIPALQKVCISHGSVGHSTGLLLSELWLCCHLHLSLYSLDWSTAYWKAAAKSQALWGALFDKLHSSAMAPVSHNKVTVLVYAEVVSFSFQSPVLLIYCGSITCPLRTALTTYSADISCSRLPFRR